MKKKISQPRKEKSELHKLIVKLTTTGKDVLDDALMKKLKTTCRHGDDEVNEAYDHLMEQLHKNHCEVRLTTFVVISELFARSKLFRDLVVANFQLFLRLTLGIESSSPLPPPKAAAEKLREQTIVCLEKWRDKYGGSYPKLTLGCEWLQSCKKVDFEGRRAQSEAERVRVTEDEERSRSVALARLDRCRAHITEDGADIEQCLVEIESCFEILLPTPAAFDIHLNDPLRRKFYGDNQSNNTQTDNLTSGKFKESSAEKCDITDIPYNSTQHQNTDEKIETNNELYNDNKLHTNNAESNLTNYLKNIAYENDTMRKHSTPGNIDSSDVEDNATINPKRTKNNDGSKITGDEISSDIITSDEKEIRAAQKSPDPVNTDKINSDEMSPEPMSPEPMSPEPHNIDETSERRLHGLTNRSLTIPIQLDVISVSENQDNRDVIQKLRELMRDVEAKYLPLVNKWLTEMSKVGADENEVKRLIDTKMRLSQAKDKFTDLHIKPLQGRVASTGDDSESDADDLEEVPEKEGYEPVIPPNLRKLYGLEPATKVTVPKVTTPHKPQPHSTDWSLRSTLTGGNVDDPTSMAGNLAKWGYVGDKEPQPSSSKSLHQSDIPTVSGGFDIDNWENPRPDNPMPNRPVLLHSFWVSKENEDRPPPDIVASLKERSIPFTGKFQPVKWACRAPLTDGKLCPRMDRYKCPFHGPVVARDNQGNPSNIEDIQKEELQKYHSQAQSSTNAWDDPELLRDIEAATGQDLGSQRSKGKGRGKCSKRKFPELTDLNADNKTSRARLERKVFNTRSLKTVSATLDRADQKRHGDRFANQFNYVFDK